MTKHLKHISIERCLGQRDEEIWMLYQGKDQVERSFRKWILNENWKANFDHTNKINTKLKISIVIFDHSFKECVHFKILFQFIMIF